MPIPVIEEALPEADAASKDLLLKDYDYLAESFWKNEAVGETRVNFFLTLVTAVVGGLVALITAEDGVSGLPLRLIVFAGLFILLVLGWITLERLLKRNTTTDQYKEGLDVIRQTYKDYYDPERLLSTYKPIRKPQRIRVREAGVSYTQRFLRRLIRPAYCKLFGVKQLDRYLERQLNNDMLGVRTFGGLTDYVAGMNALLFSGMVVTIVYRTSCNPSLAEGTMCNPVAVIVSSLAAFILGFAVQYFYATIQHIKGERALKEARYTHEFGLIYKDEGSSVKYLLVEPKGGGEPLVLPKGHIEKGECYGETAIREVQEESGVKASCEQCVDEVNFTTPTERVRGRGFLMKYISTGKKQEERRLQWMSSSEIDTASLHEETRDLLRAAERVRKERGADYKVGIIY